MKVVYIAHAYGGVAENRERAARWCAWAAVHMGVSPVADWIVLTGQLDESHRELGLRCDVALVRRCDEVWFCGDVVSPGMKVEASAHEVVRDLTPLCRDRENAPPLGGISIERFGVLPHWLREERGYAYVPFRRKT